MTGEGGLTFWSDKELRTRLGELDWEQVCVLDELEARHDAQLAKLAGKMSAADRRARFRLVPGMASC